MQELNKAYKVGASFFMSRTNVEFFLKDTLKIIYNEFV